MSKLHHHQTSSLKRKLRVRAKIAGTASRPRLSFFRSNQHLYLQVIDDQAHKSLFTVSDINLPAKTGSKTMRAQKAAAELVTCLKKEKITALVIDRGSYKYHGRIKAAVTVIREAGVEV